MWFLYQVAVAAALLVAAPVLLARRRRHYGPTLRQRLGHYGESSTSRTGSSPAKSSSPEPSPPGPLWIHAVSVGEVAVAAILARTVPADQPLLVTTVTSTGQARAREIFGPRGAEVAYLPFDLGFAVRRFFERFRPRALILIEGDYWPLALRACRRRNVPVMVANGRIGARSFGHWMKTRRLWRAFHRPVARFGVQTDDDRARLLALGAAPEAVSVTGNLKFETVAPDRDPALEAEIERLAGGRPIIIAGSTMAGEDAQVLDAFVDAGASAAALLVLVPRHPERWDAVAELVRARTLRLVRRSAMRDRADEDSRPDVLLLDSIGELAALYRLARIAFIGGTLVDTGGHNPLEAAHFAVPVVVGPSMSNFREMAAIFDHESAWLRVDDARGLGEAWRRLLEDPATAKKIGARGHALIAANRGALDRTRELIDELLDGTER